MTYFAELDEKEEVVYNRATRRYFEYRIMRCQQCGVRVRVRNLDAHTSRVHTNVQDVKKGN